MNCNKCGNPVTPGDKFCNVCGNELKVETVQPSQNIERPVPVQTVVVHTGLQGQTPVQPEEQVLTTGVQETTSLETQASQEQAPIVDNSLQTPEMVSNTSNEAIESEAKELETVIPGDEQVSEQVIQTETVSTDISLSEPKKKKSKVGLIVIIIAVLFLAGFIGYTVLSTLNEANKVNNTDKPQVNKIEAQDKYETIAYQDEYYVKYDFALENEESYEYKIGDHKLVINKAFDQEYSLLFDQNEKITVLDKFNIYHLLKSDIVIIVKPSTENNIIYIYDDNKKVDLPSLNILEELNVKSIDVKDNTVLFEVLRVKDMVISTNADNINICTQNYTQYVSDDYAVEVIYSFDLKETELSENKLKEDVKITVKQFYDNNINSDYCKNLQISEDESLEPQTDDTTENPQVSLPTDTDVEE